MEHDNPHAAYHRTFKARRLAAAWMEISKRTARLYDELQPTDRIGTVTPMVVAEMARRAIPELWQQVQEEAGVRRHSARSAVSEATKAATIAVLEELARQEVR